MNKNKKTWVEILEIGNSLSNALSEYPDETNRETLYVSDGFNCSVYREWDLEKGAKPDWVDASEWNSGAGWHGFKEGDVSRLLWKSDSSGAVLIASKDNNNGGWELEYQPPENSEYHSWYEELFKGTTA